MREPVTILNYHEKHKSVHINPEGLKRLRNEIEEKTEAFLLKGGKVKEIKFSQSSYKELGYALTQQGWIKK